MRSLSMYSSHDPNGVALLINLFIEIGIRVEWDFEESMWCKSVHEQGWALREEYSWFKAVLPSLNVKQSHTFYPPQVVYWTHRPLEEIPESHSKDITIVIVRDPRDAIYSMWRRNYSHMSFEDYLDVRMPPYFSNRIEAWVDYYAPWTNSKHTVIRFEDLKLKTEKIFRGLLNEMEVVRSDEEIRHAVEASSFDIAKKNESFYMNGETRQGALVRAGLVYEWKSDVERLPHSSRIEDLTRPLLRKFGYGVNNHSFQKLEDEYNVRSGCVRSLSRELDFKNLSSIQTILKNTSTHQKKSIRHRLGVIKQYLKSLEELCDNSPVKLFLRIKIKTYLSFLNTLSKAVNNVTVSR